MRLTVAVACLFFVGCERQPEEIRHSIERLEDEEARVGKKLRLLKTSTASVEENLGVLRTQAAELERVVASRGDPIHLVQFESRKNSFTLDLGKQFQDSMNAFKFELPVDREFYQRARIGEAVADQGVWGSTWGSVTITVVGKRIERRPQEGETP